MILYTDAYPKFTDRCILGLFQPSENGVTAYLSKIATEERKVENLTRLIDKECTYSNSLVWLSNLVSHTF